jgi:branched-chain amino acid transport system ATP-binding protein
MKNSKENLLVSDLTFGYDSYNIIENLSLSLQLGEIILICGENGSGKTTLINLLSGFLKPTQGRISVNGYNFRAFSPYTAFYHGITRTYQEPVVFDQISVFESLIVAAYSRKKVPFWWNILSTKSFRKINTAISNKCIELLQSANLLAYKNVNAGELSYGQRKLLGVLQAFLSSSKIILLDEPIAGIDDEQTQIIIKLIKNGQNEKTPASILIISHEIEPFNEIINTLYKLENGKLRNLK